MGGGGYFLVRGTGEKEAIGDHLKTAYTLAMSDDVSKGHFAHPFTLRSNFSREISQPEIIHTGKDPLPPRSALLSLRNAWR